MIVCCSFNLYFTDYYWSCSCFVFFPLRTFCSVNCLFVYLAHFSFELLVFFCSTCRNFLYIIDSNSLICCYIWEVLSPISDLSFNYACNVLSHYNFYRLTWSSCNIYFVTRIVALRKWKIGFAVSNFLGKLIFYFSISQLILEYDTSSDALIPCLVNISSHCRIHKHSCVYSVVQFFCILLSGIITLYKLFWLNKILLNKYIMTTKYGYHLVVIMYFFSAPNSLLWKMSASHCHSHAILVDCQSWNPTLLTTIVGTTHTRTNRVPGPGIWILNFRMPVS